MGVADWPGGHGHTSSRGQHVHGQPTWGLPGWGAHPGAPRGSPLPPPATSQAPLSPAQPVTLWPGEGLMLTSWPGGLTLSGSQDVRLGGKLTATLTGAPEPRCRVFSKHEGDSPELT